MAKHPQLTRRRFLAAGAATAAGAAAAGGAAASSTSSAAAARRHSGGSFRMFVVADAHFGWESSNQPSVAHSRQAIRGILEEHPDLDLFVDAGDAHHSHATGEAIADWVDTICNGIGPIPMLYCTGNHDGIGFRDSEPFEDQCLLLGSTPARPYYSMDIKGVHIVSLPQLMAVDYCTEESLEWLDLDLRVAQGRTTIIVSHNALRETTRHHDDHGYRTAANTRAVNEVLRRHPHVAMWIHGHNHTYEGVRHGGRLFVSCGRIGGFDPQWNADRIAGDNLGGILVEVHPDGVEARAFGGIQRRYFQNFTEDNEAVLAAPGPTSLDPGAQPALSWGFGRSAPGVRRPAYRHFIPAAGAPAIVRRTASPHEHLSENPEFAWYGQRTNRENRTKLLAGATIIPRLANEAGEDTTWGWLSNGISLNPVAETRSVIIPRGSDGRNLYYRVHPGSTFRMRVRVNARSAATTIRLHARLFDSNRNRLDDWASNWLTPGVGWRDYDFAVPLAGDPTHGIYGDPASSLQCQVFGELEVADLDDFLDIGRIELVLDQSGSASSALAIDGSPVALSSVDGLEAGTAGVISGSSRHVLDLNAPGTTPRTVHVREPSIEWQVRNAVARRDGPRIVVDAIRNPFTRAAAIVFAPLRRTEDPFLARAEGLPALAVTPFTEADGLIVEPLAGRAAIPATSFVLLGRNDAARLFVANAGPDPIVEGGDVLGVEDGFLVIVPEGSVPVVVRKG